MVLRKEEITAARIAETQSGLLSLDDLLDAGISRSTVYRRLTQGTLRQVRPGVFAFAGTPILTEHLTVANVLSVDRRAAASHDTAAHLWGLTDKKPQDTHVVVRRWHREHRAEAIVHESLDFIPADRVLLDGVPVTVPERTIVDLGATSRWLVESALSRGLRNGLFSVDDVRRFVERVQRRGRRGVGVIRPLIEFHDSKDTSTESILEDRFLRVLNDYNVPTPHSQFEVRDPALGFVCRADFAYPDRRLLIELDGQAYHSDGLQFQGDRSKQNRTQLLGWTTLRFTWHDVVQRPHHTASLVRQTLSVLA